MNTRFSTIFKTGILPTGSRNTIADVAGVRVGHVTIKNSLDTCTGLTIIDPGADNLFTQKIPGAVAVGNGYGKLAGSTQVQELGQIETLIALTNTLAVGPVVRGVVDLTLSQNPNLPAYTTVNAVVGETNDGYLNAIHNNVMSADHVRQAYESCTASFALGCVGAGTGTRAFAWKGGIGSASRLVTINNQTYTVGVLTQTNFGGMLTMLGTPVGEQLGKTKFDQWAMTENDGSCMMVVATDAPLTSRQLRRLAQRCFIGMGRTGSVMSHGSGDYAIAFSTNRAGLEGSGVVGSCLSDSDLNLFFQAVVEATEESIYDALFAAQDTTGRDGHVLTAIPQTEVIAILKKNPYIRNA